ncbi:MAG: nucleotidyltransferase domain-containing protein [Desulfuromonadaceae bacterium]|nr:nucleotidyltransferase domain-containing protein [Desulfuromonas sp.]MDY0185560.1 nucleotidyltransferase domain-containing protein [Desulfuromonadaceae bacterium]
MKIEAAIPGLPALRAQQICAVLEHHPQVERAVLFGSQARGVTGPLSDIDIAVFVQEREETFMLRLLLLEQLQRLGGLVPVDLVVQRCMRSYYDLHRAAFWKQLLRTFHFIQ